MNRYKFLIFALVSFPLFAAENFCGIKNISFKNGESISYKVYYHYGRINAGAGEVVFSTVVEKLKGKNVYHIKGDGKTYKSYDWFFKVRDVYETWIDTATLLPLKFSRNVKEGSMKYIRSAEFNQEKKIAISPMKTIKIDPCTQDVLSTIYYARNINFSSYKPGDKIPFTMYIDDELYPLYLLYTGKEKIKIGDGYFNAIKFEPKLIAGTMFKEDEKMTVWVTDDNNHIPLRIESEISVGEVRVDVIDFKNLKNPMTSYIGRTLK